MKRIGDNYFDFYDNYFWQWDDNNESLSIPNGSTIAYRKYVVEVMNVLVEQALPSFGTLLLAIIATNQHSLDSLRAIQEKFETDLLRRYELKDVRKDILDKAFSFLKRINSLPDEYKEGQKRMLLFRAIFYNVHNPVSPKNGHLLVHEINSDTMPVASFMKHVVGEKIIMSDFRPLAILDSRFPTESSIIDAIIAIPDDVEIELEGTTQKQDLLADLIADPRTFHIGSLIKQLWGGLNIPMHNTLVGEQPLGGVSDIANKGDFDKLLISEYANDDLLFMSRLANNEALYLNREVPPQNNKFNRYLLIDISLRNWGTPRILAFAIMLALAKNNKSKIKYEVSLVGDKCYDVGLSSVADIITIQSYLDICQYPTNGLEQFFSTHDVKNSEVVFITNKESLQQLELQTLINNYRHYFNFTIYTDSLGNIAVYRMLKNSSKLIQSLSIDLQCSWKKELPIDKNETLLSLLDAIIEYKQANKSTFLLSPTADYKLMILEDNYYCLDRNRLLKRVADNKGWEVVFDEIEKGLSAFQVALNGANELLFLTIYDNRKIMILHNLKTGKSISLNYPKGISFAQRKIFFDDQYFYILNVRFRETYKISLDLTIEVLNTTISNKRVDEIEQLKQAEIETYKKTNIDRHIPIIKNVKKLSITHDNRLVINRKHTFNIFSSGLYLSPYSSLNDQIKEESISFNKTNKFKFRNGVTVETDYGVLKIRLNDSRTIEIPLFIDFPLAIAVDGKVSGNSYFHKGENDNNTIDPQMIALLTNETTWN